MPGDLLGPVIQGPGAIRIQLYVVLARCLWLGIQRENNGLSNHKHIASTTQSFILRAPGALSIKLNVVLARCLWLGKQRENKGFSNNKHIASTTKSFILRGPGAISIKLCVVLAMCLLLESPLFSLQFILFISLTSQALRT